MQVITLTQEDFEAHATRLAREVAKGSGRRYDAIVAVRRGGAYVCDVFLRHFPRERYGERHDVWLQRPSTKHKEGITGKLLKRLPYPMLDTMRMGESLMLELLRKLKKTDQAPDVGLTDGLAKILKETDRPQILLIDDAIDSGDTLYAIVYTLRKMNPEAEISIAVMTETTRHPRIRSNYTLYRNRTLIRFPWSNDYKEN